MQRKTFFYLQILFLILVCFVVKELNHQKSFFKYDLKNQNLENCLALNLPCLRYNPSLWEIQNISGLSLTQAIKIKKILKNPPDNKKDFILKIKKIYGIGEKKSKQIGDIFFFK